MSVPGVDPERSPLDAFRLAVASSVHKGLPEVTLENAYKAVDIGKKGVDFTVAVARFRLGGKPDVWAKKVEESVSQNCRPSREYSDSSDSVVDATIVCCR